MSTPNSHGWSQNGILDIRLGYAASGHIMTGIYHEKFGIFADEVDSIAFTGSLTKRWRRLLELRITSMPSPHGKDPHRGPERRATILSGSGTAKRRGLT